MDANQIWKIGVTQCYNPATKEQWRYPESFLTQYDLEFVVIWGPADRASCLAVEQIAIGTYYLMYGDLPPGNKMWR